ncbi:MAG: bifunctional homocysteine S-methyltransferase/methylenetetrahydrofolate reductase [Bdellovibrionaceae bacterium]|nr:bifunctional homocysteine S-methyltransferase/methylenetetrahydrofolate reductase [Bdellovibrionales bacterium]MCB9084539.1 bifunctional homocysteine S-methyltransferase/methylenetetrahydrofolate reductase [Pseudobdellovibrionaceae bacterium]
MAKIPLKEFLAGGETAVMDGAMATALYERGFYINRSFEELCLTDPKGVKDIIQSFKDAGAKFLTTNSFSATKPKLTEFGLQERQKEILTASARLALEVAGDEAYVLGLIGPLPVLIEPFGPTAYLEAVELYEEAARILDEAGVDGFTIEGFHNLKNLEAALVGVRKFSDKPVFVHLSINEDMRSSYGNTPEALVQVAEDFDADVVGFCGEVGPSGMLTALERVRKLTDKPISLRPNAGLPKYVNDQWIYLCNPDYLAKFAKRYIQGGARFVGGHCGVYADHIKAVANSLRMTQNFNHRESTYSALIQPVNDVPKETLPIKERSRLGEALANRERIFTIEIIPPKGVDTDGFFKHCKKLQEGGVKFVNIPDGARAVARMSSLHLAAYVQEHFDLEAIPHLTTRDRNIIGLQSDLLGSHIAGVRNVLVVTGDPPKLGNMKGATGVYDVDAIGLTHIAARMNKGLDLGGSSFGSPTQFCVGVALNPTASYHELEMSRYRYKVEAGADFAITQPIYDIEAYLKFMDKVKDVKIPIIMGIWPLVSLRNAEFLKNEVPGVSVPDWVIKEMEKANGDKEEAVKRGTEIAMKTMHEAKKLVAGFQVSAPFNRVEVALDVIHALSD